MNAERITEELEWYFNEYLSGSGFDTDWGAEYFPNQKTIHLTTEYHAMSEHGYYITWIPVRIVLDVHTDENGDYVSYRSARYRKYVSTVFIGEYIEDTVYETLNNYRDYIKTEEYIGTITVCENDYSVVRKGYTLIAGTVCNAGLLHCYKYRMDADFSLDENLSEFIDDMNEAEKGDAGSYTDNLFFVRK